MLKRQRAGGSSRRGGRRICRGGERILSQGLSFLKGGREGTLPSQGRELELNADFEMTYFLVGGEESASMVLKSKKGKLASHLYLRQGKWALKGGFPRRGTLADARASSFFGKKKKRLSNPHGEET